MSPNYTPLTASGIGDYIRDMQQRGCSLSFIFGTIAGGLNFNGGDPSGVPMGDKPGHFATGLQAAAVALNQLCHPPSSWHPFSQN